MYKFGTKESKRNLILCDTPGFGDNSGIEVDISNGLGLIRSLSKASSVRVVIILSYESIIKDKSKGIIDIANIISSLINNLK